ncbi:aminoacyl-tRNA hydrolase [Allochromatium vinosum]|uniref:Peptidyl-tRNA hydrolase n=1 Tax=Allochromatium vinosum (strain ATCC 17899 / DSM 180 / NBRC 103801 / NCIMB 10441 / D) TaxID=572477 RepID=D3RN09_ALLVD|nr:aminoacyl-tRNA hydrolase [Allochromatium vinosum]ADC63297.1 peptidyl-tRNA hydrolase [Allochromatium vinosum DSM 180]MBK1655335.1 aminoacyl-tRNA hydrolase [Allochromatium vinosum]
MSDAGIQLIVGLGNPGAQYEATRHNVGFWWVEAIARAQGESFRAEPKFLGELARVRIAGQDVRLLKPSTYMNRSGQSVVAVARYFDIPPERILIAHDELDLPVGVARIKQGGGHAGHNGLRDSISALGSREFWRLRIGIAHPGDRTLVTGYVLGRPSRDDESRIRESLDDADRRLAELVEGQFQLAMNRLHSQR